MSARVSSGSCAGLRPAFEIPKDPVALGQYLLHQAAELAIQNLPGAPPAEALVQLQRDCMLLGDAVGIDALSDLSAVAFWLNARNLAVLLSLLLSAHLRSVPSSEESWAKFLSCVPLFAGAWPVRPADVDHLLFEAGVGSPLPFPSRQSLPRGAALKFHQQEMKVIKSWIPFGLWLPVAFGLPPLRIYQPHLLLMQLRLNAEALVVTCFKGSTSTSKASLSLPPILQVASPCLWQPLLKARGEEEALTGEACEVNWVFDAGKVIVLGPDHEF
eukprot:TRINITY_DN41674_c0_g1_i1.p1 TRINITY_DN41674_c0_g1~~TRINITY_DN41674_c0_g1_i1.p1  ORF type:complete len:295 (+),score=45.79 TRINITY_DN41674_c0_g1_i1:70-885(+)